MKLYRKISLIVFSVLMCMSFIHTIKANQNTLGSIELAFEDKKVSEISFSIYKIGDLIDESLIQYSPSSSFENLQSDLNHLSTASDCENTIKECLKIIEERQIHPTQTKKGQNNGNIKFDNLDLGLYLVKQDKTLNDFRTKPVLISVPLNMDSTLIYDVVAIPKYSNEPDTDEPTIIIDTSDEQNILPYVIGLGVSGCVGIVLYIFMKKDSNLK